MAYRQFNGDGQLKGDAALLAHHHFPVRERKSHRVFGDRDLATNLERSLAGGQPRTPWPESSADLADHLV